MASFVSTDAHFTAGGVDLSDYVQSITFNYEAEEVDETAMGDTTRKNKGGLKVWSFDVTFKQDFAASAVDATLWTTIGVGSTATVIYRPVAATAVGTTNPNYTGTALLASYGINPGNGVGDLATATARFSSAGALSRATA